MSEKDISKRFRGFLPVVVDVETGGFNPETDALLEIACVILSMDQDGMLKKEQMHSFHVEPFEGANIEAAALEFTGIRPDHPLRLAHEEREALTSLFRPIRKAVRDTGCKRAILVGHNAAFDLAFVNAAAQRAEIRRNPFHPFSTFDTVTLAGAILGQTVLKRAVQTIGLEWDSDAAHSARYDTEQTAELFCFLVNNLKELHSEFTQHKGT